MTKTCSGVKKRFRITKGGKILHKKAGRSHLLSKKSSARKRRLGKKVALSRGDARKARALL